MSRHAKPWCWEKNKFSQDAIKNMPYGLKCPGCGLMITNEDVCDEIPLQNFVSLVKSAGSRLAPGLWG